MPDNIQMNPLNDEYGHYGVDNFVVLLTPIDMDSPLTITLDQVGSVSFTSNNEEEADAVCALFNRTRAVPNFEYVVINKAAYISTFGQAFMFQSDVFTANVIAQGLTMMYNSGKLSQGQADYIGTVAAEIALFLQNNEEQ